MAKEVLLSDAPGGGGGHGDFSAPPPPGGLGNFKGVMLCNRPTEVNLDRAVRDADAPPPFKSTVSATHNDLLGLNPKQRELHTDSHAKMRGPSAALRKHVKWLKELQKQMTDEKDAIDKDGQDAEKKKERMKKFCEKQREAVHTLLNADHEVTKEHLEEAVKTAGGPTKTTDGKRVKPLWAMTETEKEVHQEQEGNDLIGFAEDLDFDKYIGDLEFRQNLEVLKDRAGKLEKEQAAFKDELVNEFNADDESTAVGSPRNLDGDLLSGLEGSSLGVSEGADSLGGKRAKLQRTEDPDQVGPDWDSSTCCGDDKVQVSEGDKDMAARLLEMNPNLRGIHSEKSVQKVLQKQREKEEAKQLVDLVEHLQNNVAAPEPRIVVSDDTKGKAKKKVDPSMLPYLYRSPAI
jgi:hypothetical protein